MNNEIKLMAFDLDGTLITGPNNYISQETIDALDFASSKGVKLCIATGRSLPFIEPIFIKFKRIDYIIYGNGVGLLDVQNGGVQGSKNIIPKEDVDEIINFAISFESFIQLQANGKVYVDAKTEKLLRERYPSDFTVTIEDYIVKTDNYLQVAQEFGIEKLNILLSNSKDKEIVFNHFLENKKLFVSSSWEDNVEINSFNASKGIALKSLVDSLGFTSENVFAIGDNDNDVSMIEYAKYGFSFPDGTFNAKNSAKYLTSYAADNGAAKAIHTLLDD